MSLWCGLTMHVLVALVVCVAGELAVAALQLLSCCVGLAVVVMLCLSIVMLLVAWLLVPLVLLVAGMCVGNEECLLW